MISLQRNHLLLKRRNRNINVADEAGGFEDQTRFALQLAGQCLLYESAAETLFQRRGDDRAAALAPFELEAMRNIVDRPGDRHAPVRHDIAMLSPVIVNCLRPAVWNATIAFSTSVRQPAPVQLSRIRRSCEMPSAAKRLAIVAAAASTLVAPRRLCEAMAEAIDSMFLTR